MLRALSNRRNRSRELKGSALNPNAAIEARYYRNLRKLIEPMARETHAKLVELFKGPEGQEYFAQDDTLSGQAKLVLQQLINKFQPIFNIAAKPQAAAMTAQSSHASATALESSLKQLSNGLTLKTNFITGDLREVLNATIAENVSLIKSIPSEYFTQIQGAVMRSITTGNGLQDLVPFLQKYEGVTVRRARNIARDQTRKAFSNLNATRMEKLGITRYEWLHSAGGQKPRKLHQEMSGKVYSLADPPVIDLKTGQRGKPGDLINCRCRMVPVIEFNEG